MRTFIPWRKFSADPIVLLPFLALIAGCAHDPGGTKIIAHAGTGSGYEYPKNSREALLKALDIGADGIEMDVQMSSDKVLVIYHDNDLSTITPCKGLINSFTWNELRSCDPTLNGRKFKIERLDSLLFEAAIQYPDKEFVLDVKLFAHGEWWPYVEDVSDAIAALYDRPEIKGGLMVECMVEDFLSLLKRKRPELPVFLYKYDAEEAIGRALREGYDGITMLNKHIGPDQVRNAREQGLQVTITASNSWWSDRSALRKMPDRLQTDSPEDLKN